MHTILVYIYVQSEGSEPRKCLSQSSFVYFCPHSSKDTGRGLGAYVRFHWDTPVFTVTRSISYSSLKTKQSLCDYLDMWSWTLLCPTPLNTEKIHHRLFRLWSTPWTILSDWLVQIKGWQSLVMLLSDVIRSHGKKSYNSPRNTWKQKEQSSHKGYLHKQR